MALEVEVETTHSRLDRRTLLRGILGFSIISTLAMVVAPILGFLVPPKSADAGAGGRVSAGKLADLPPGEGKVVAMGSKPAIVVDGPQGVTAFSAICTHLGCIVAWDATARTIHCPCHDGQFNPANGAVISGPPPAPLPAITTAVENGEIFLVTGS
jgi:cytochrome b6-f complex iron-sulfur subunit